MKIIVVSYKPESIDYCMGNVMEHYNSDHIVGKFDNIKEAALQIANCKAKKLGQGEEPYEHSIFAFNATNDSTVQESEEIVELIKTEADKMADILIKQNEENERKEFIEKQKRIQEQQEKHELLQYEKLKKKFETNIMVIK